MSYRTLNFNNDWLFIQDYQEEMNRLDFDDSKWQKLNLPHDWSITHPFSPDALGYCRSAYLPNGKGCYRKHFRIHEDLRGLKCVVAFGGVYKNAEVFVNGQKVGSRPWGYIQFEFDITDKLKCDEENLIVVKVDNSKLPGTRWYSGTGIYRDAALKFYKELEFPSDRIYVTTCACSAEYAKINVRYAVHNNLSKRTRCESVNALLNANGSICAEIRKSHWIGAELEVYFDDTLEITNPELWSIDFPNLYTVKSVILFEGEIIAEQITRIGIRSFEYSSRNGLLVNGKPIKLHGVCLHNDGGALGVACGKQTFIRQLQILKTMGCNAVRTAHHPFSPLFLDACDELGILVLAESFDEWQEPIRVAPCSDGEWQSLYVHYYADIFDQYAEQDLADMICRDRNHPSIFAWSVGNEIPQMHKSSGYYIAEKLIEIVHNYDSRPVTCAAIPGDSPNLERNIGLFQIAGFNYPNGKVLDKFHTRYPEKPLIVTEHYSAQTRRPKGIYLQKSKLPELGYAHKDAENFIRGMEHTEPGAVAWQENYEREYVMGEFIWTGFDYLGEPTPYDYPAHTSFFGVIDTCGLPKDGYYFYRGAWCSEPIIHIASHWDYNSGDEVELLIISNCPEVELFLNKTSLGRKKCQNGKVLFDTVFREGELTAYGYLSSKDTIIAKTSVHTSKMPSLMIMESYFNRELSVGEIEYITCKIVDSSGNPVRNINPEVVFEVSNIGEILGVDNGNQMSLYPYKGNCVDICDAHCMVIIRALKSGTMQVLARVPEYRKIISEYTITVI
jgi:beta-galactosidase